MLCYINLGVSLYLGIGRLMPIKSPQVRNIIRTIETTDIYTLQFLKEKKKSIEHVVPISYLKREDRWDPINLVTTTYRLNNWRQDRYFTDRLEEKAVDVLRMGHARHVRSSRFFMPDQALSHRGRIARIQLYMIHRYDYLEVRFPRDQRRVLLQWMREDPITMEEIMLLMQRVWSLSIFGRRSWTLS